jgi:hypothetical protein
MGYLAYNKHGERTYVSVAQNMEEAKRPVGEVWHCEANDEEAYFASYEKFYYYDQKEVKIIHGAPAWPHLAKVDSHIFVFDKKKGLQYIKNGNTYDLPQLREFLNGGWTRDILPYGDGQILIYTYKGNFFIYDFKQLLNVPVNQWSSSNFSENLIQEFPVEIDEYLKKMNIRRAIQLKNKDYAFIGDNIVLTSAQLEIKKVIGKGLGYNRDQIYQVYGDSHGDLWVTSAKGINKIKLSNAVSVINEDSEFEAYCLDFEKHKGEYYVGTWNRLVKLKANKYGERGKGLVDLWEDQVWSIQSLGEHLVFGTAGGLYEFINDKAYPLFRQNQMTAYDMAHLKQTPGYIAIASQGLLFLKYEEQSANQPIRITDTIMIPEIKEHVRYVKEDEHGDVWVRTEPLELYVIRFNDADKKDYQVVKVNNEEKMEVYSYDFFNNQVYTTGTGNIYTLQYDRQSLSNFRFVADSVLKEKLNGAYLSNLHASDDKLYVGNGNSLAIVKRSSNGDYSVDNDKYRNVGVSEVVDFGNDLWAAKVGTIYNFDMDFKAIPNESFSAVIRSVFINNDSLYQYGTYFDESSLHDSLYFIGGKEQPEVLKPNLHYKENALTFTYGTNFYDKKKKFFFSYFLEGYDEDWSPYSKESRKEDTNLKAGDYVFKVKCFEDDMGESKMTEFRFTIEKPWYGTWLAYSIYFIFFAFLVFLIIQLSLRRLKKNNERLEQAVKESTEKVEMQNLKLQEAQIQLTQIMDDVKNELGKASIELMEATTSQAGAIEEVSASVGQMTEDIDQTAKNSTEMLKNAQAVEEDAAISVEIVSDTVNSIENITSEIAFVSEFARMTNLLSLNAAIEAARAGEHGRSFSEVAKQVKTLAEQSQEAAVKITKLSKSGLAQSHEANSKINELKNYLQNTVQLIHEINESSQKQAVQATQINSSIQEVSNYIQTTAGLAEKLDEAIKSLSIEEQE